MLGKAGILWEFDPAVQAMVSASEDFPEGYLIETFSRSREYAPDG